MSIRVVDPTCVKCHKPLTDPLSRALKLGPECRKGMSAVQLRDAMQRAAERDDPFRIPEERPASLEAQINNRNARAAADPEAVQLCVRHENPVGKCPQCKWEADPDNASVRILRELCGWSFADRRAERIAVQTARRDRGIPSPARQPAPRPTLRRTSRRPAPASSPPATQLELL